MMKRIFALLLCLIMAVGCLVACNKNEEEEEDPGAYINMYLTDMVYDFDPAHALTNESALKVVNLIFANLFKIDEKGKVKNDLVSKYKIVEDEKNQEYKMLITLKETAWSDGTPVSADNVVYTWKRLLDTENSNSAAALLYDVKNARAIAHGDASIDDLGVYAVDQTLVEVTFEGKIDYDRFIRNLASPALIPLPEATVVKSDDWAKKPATIICSGPFKLRKTDYGIASDTPQLVLERNDRYMRDKEKDSIDKAVTPYRIIIDYSMTEEQIKEAYDAGEIFFMGDIPLSLRANYKDVAEVKDVLSTHTYYLQTQTFDVPLTLEEEAEIAESIYNEETAELEGDETRAPFVPPTFTPKQSAERRALIEKLESINKNAELFRNADVRKALSLAIDRDAIASAIVFAKAANALVPYGVFNEDRAKESFRAIGGKLIETSADVNAAKQLLNGINAADYTINISVAAYDDVHMKIAEMVQAAWQALGFNVNLVAIDVIVNDDYYKYTDSVPEDIMDDVHAETFRSGLFEVIAVDLVAPSTDAFSILAPFAHDFSGGSIDMENFDYTVPTHITGFNNEEYNTLIEEAHAAATIAERSEKLHAAEELLMEELPVIPIIFNQSAVLQSKMLSRIGYDYFGSFTFTKTKLKNYEMYTPEETEVQIPTGPEQPAEPEDGAEDAEGGDGEE